MVLAAASPIIGRVRPTIPATILSLGHARSAARRSRNFREADRLRDDIEAAGYRVVDRGGDFLILPAHPADIVEEDGRVRYGWSGAVPSHLGDPPTAVATLVIVAEGGAEPLRRTLAGLRTHAPDGTQVVIVAPPDDALEADLTPDDLLSPIAGAPPDVVHTAKAFRPAAARNAGARPARGAVLAWLAAGATVSGDVVSPLVATLADPTVAVAGAVGLVAADIRRFSAGPAGDVDAIDRVLLAFRRDEVGIMGTLDERFFGDEQLDRWWSLVLRDGPDLPEEDTDGGADVAPEARDADPDVAEDDGADPDADDLEPYVARRAIALDLPIDPVGAIPLAPEPAHEGEAGRRRKRDLYRLIDRFTGRPDLLRPPSAEG